MLAPLPSDYIGAPQEGQGREGDGSLLGSVGGMFGAGSIPSLTGGGSSASTNPYTVFGSVNVNTGYAGTLLIGGLVIAGYLLWKRFSK